MALQPARIICAVDFSSLTPPAVDLATEIARTFDAELFLFHAVFHANDPMRDGNVTGRANRWRIEADEHLADLNQLMTKTDVRWQPILSQGEPVAELDKAIRRHRIDLALAASHDVSALKRLFIGTVIERMARRLSIPFMIMRTPHKPSPFRFERILVSCSANQSDRTLLETALLFRTLFEAELHLCHAIESPLDVDVVDPTEGPYEEVQALLRHRLQARMVKMLADMSEQPVVPETALFEAAPHEALRAYARQCHPDLIIVGVKSEGVIKKRLIGSTTESVVRRAKATVLIVPLPEAGPRKEKR